ncbi:unnamed protein product [Phyllotreta striolata]|uniref:Uncharacterized protein n=1 Tax=Phyllotreta striolata TaxID=444603 RepID=A0A9N9TX70_PHYSR|nr:unnamed protein product [Phyllotreta striolata]
MKLPIHSIILATIPLVCWASPGKKDAPVDAKVLYDQRQEGEWNVRAHLDNFIIMVIPSQAAGPTSSPSLLDFLTKSFPKASLLKRSKFSKKPRPQEAIPEETLQFIESKTAPYHVDLSKTPLPLPYSTVALQADLAKAKEDASPGTPPKTDLIRSRRSTRFYSPVEESKSKTAARKHKKTVKETGGKSFDFRPMGWQEGRACAPGELRDSYGVCTSLKY